MYFKRRVDDSFLAFHQFRRTKKIDITSGKMPIILVTFTCNSEKISLGKSMIYVFSQRAR